jgi:hypothetical protein
MPVFTGRLVIELEGGKLLCINHPATAKPIGIIILPTVYFASHFITYAVRW